MISKKSTIKKIQVIIWLLLFCIIIRADEKVNGYYINNDGDTIKCIYLFFKSGLRSGPTYINDQYKIDIITSDGVKKVLFPDTVSAIVFNERKFVSFKNELGLPKGLFSSRAPFIFLEQLIFGYVKLYECRYMEKKSYSVGMYSGSSDEPASKYFIQKGDSALEELDSYSNKRFRQLLYRMFYDDTVLVNKIGSDNYGPEDRFTLIKHYNEDKKNDVIAFNNDTSLCTKPDVNPLFKGKALNNLNFYFQSKIKWPKDVAKNKKVDITGIIEKDGTFTSIKMNGFENKTELNQEFLEVAKSMQKWTPGRCRGFTVRSEILFTIKYK